MPTPHYIDIIAHTSEPLYTYEQYISTTITSDLKDAINNNNDNNNEDENTSSVSSYNSQKSNNNSNTHPDYDSNCWDTTESKELVPKSYNNTDNAIRQQTANGNNTLSTISTTTDKKGPFCCLQEDEEADKDCTNFGSNNCCLNPSFEMISKSIIIDDQHTKQQEDKQAEKSLQLQGQFEKQGKQESETCTSYSAQYQHYSDNNGCECSSMDSTSSYQWLPRNQNDNLSFILQQPVFDDNFSFEQKQDDDNIDCIQNFQPPRKFLLPVSYDDEMIMRIMENSRNMPNHLFKENYLDKGGAVYINGSNTATQHSSFKGLLEETSFGDEEEDEDEEDDNLDIEEEEYLYNQYFKKLFKPPNNPLSENLLLKRNFVEIEYNNNNNLNSNSNFNNCLYQDKDAHDDNGGSSFASSGDQDDNVSISSNDDNIDTLQHFEFISFTDKEDDNEKEKSKDDDNSKVKKTTAGAAAHAIITDKLNFIKKPSINETNNNITTNLKRVSIPRALTIKEKKIRQQERATHKEKSIKQQKRRKKKNRTNKNKKDSIKKIKKQSNFHNHHHHHHQGKHRFIHKLKHYNCMDQQATTTSRNIVVQILNSNKSFDYENIRRRHREQDEEEENGILSKTITINSFVEEEDHVTVDTTAVDHHHHHHQPGNFRNKLKVKVKKLIQVIKYRRG